MRLLSNINSTKNNSDEGLWSVDHIIPAKDCVVMRGKEPYPGYVVRLVKYKRNIEERVGFRYLLVDKDLYPEKIDFGNTYYINKDIIETIEVTFNDDKYRIRHLIEPLQSDTLINEALDTQIQNYFSQIQGPDSFSFTEEDANPLTESNKHRVWARVYIHYVGQGDTIVLELPDKQIWMVDAFLWRQDRRERFDEWMLKKFRKKKIDRLIISHFHYDHIHSIPYIIQNYNPDQVVIIDSLRHRTSSVARALHYAGNHLYILPDEEITQLGLLQIQLHRTDKFSSITNSRNPNNHEISVMLKSENGYAFLAGDIPGSMCDDLLNRSFCQGVKSNGNLIYKVSHHGSKTGYDGKFFQKFHPRYSIISCGQGNRFGHPHDPPVSNLLPHTITWKWDDDSRQYDL